MAKGQSSSIDYHTQCLEALAVARAYIKREAPYYSTIVYGFVPHFAEGIGTLGVTAGMALIIDPKWFVEMENEVGHIKDLSKSDAAYRMRAGVLVHEANHILRGIDRVNSLIRTGIDKEIVNAGFDIPINDDLRDTGWHLPTWGMFSDKLGLPKGLTGEQYVELLLKMQQQNPQKYDRLMRNMGNMGGGGKEGKDGQDSRGGGGGGGKVTAGKCGGCAGNEIGDLEQSVDSEVGRSKGDQQRIRKEAMVQIREAASSPGRGKLPMSLQELLGQNEKKAVVPWRTRLRRTIRRASGRIQAGRADFSMKRPSKRSYSRGILRPGMIDKKPEIFCVEDSSGSMGPDQLKSVRAEILGVFQQLGIADMWFCDIDADVAVKPRRIRMNDLVRLPVHGRGGTDFRPGIEIARSLVPKPDILIYLTDGDGVAPKHAPKDLTVVWCIVPTPHGRRPAHWGELVVVSDDQKLLEPYEMNYDEEEEEDE